MDHRDADPRLDAGPRGRDRRLELGDDPALEDAALEQRVRVVDRDRVDGRAVLVEEAGDVGDEGDLVRADARRRAAPRPRPRSRSAALRRAERRRGSSPAASASSTAPGREGRGSPTRPSSSTCTAARPISSPMSGTARSPIAAQTRALTSARSSRTTSMPASVVTRRPSTNWTGRPRRCISAEICGPAPWTTTTGPPSPSSSQVLRDVVRTAPPTLSDAWSRRVLRVDPHVVVGEVGREVARLAGAEAEVELDPADLAARVDLGSFPSPCPPRRPACR